MLAANYSTVRNNLKDYCDKAYDEDEVVIVTRKEEKNVVIMSLDKYNSMVKDIQNVLYMSKIDRGFRQIENGRGTSRELIEV